MAPLIDVDGGRLTAVIDPDGVVLGRLYDVDGVLVYQSATSPVFADDTGDAQMWTRGTQIAAIQVPVATGKPTPTYAVRGTLPAGISFNPTTRQITGTPTGSGSGTITIRATNSAGHDDWTVGYAIAIPSRTVTLTLPNASASVATSLMQWSYGENNRLNLGTTLAAPGVSGMYLVALSLGRPSPGLSPGRVNIALARTQTERSGAAGPDFSTQMEGSGTITITASDGNSITVTGIGDATEPYSWTPSNANAVAAFANRVVGLANKTATVTFDDQSGSTPAPPAPPAGTGVTLTLTAAASGSNIGAFGQHRSPVGGGLLNPSTFSIGGKTYQVRGWYTKGNNQLELNLNDAQQETDFRAAGLTLNLGQGQTINTGNLVNTGSVLNIAVTAQYVAGQTYTITLSE